MSWRVIIASIISSFILLFSVWLGTLPAIIGGEGWLLLFQDVENLVRSDFAFFGSVSPEANYNIPFGPLA